ncbi:NOP5/NOP56 family protein [Thermoproteota archaeon]
MPRLYLYSNSAGSFVLNQNLFVIDKVLFSDKEIISYSSGLEKAELIDPEKKLLKKHKKGQFVFVGFKTDMECDISNLGKVSSALKTSIKDVNSALKHANTIITINKISHSVNEDICIMQAVNHLSELEKISNTMAKRLREWYSYYLPEFSESVRDHEKFVELILKKPKNQLMKELRLKKDQSMGGELKKNDIDPIMDLAKELISVYKLKEKQKNYIENLMKEYCPNVTAVAGAVIGAKLLDQAGSLKKLSEFPSSTVQVLGAEEAFFRHMTTGSKPPKYGFIHEHPFIAQTDKKSKGKIARALADKISIASKVDYFKGEFVGNKLRKQVESKLGKSK